MRFHLYEYLNITRHSVLLTGMTLSAGCYHHTVIYAGRDCYLDDFLSADYAFATALGTLVLDGAACSVAGGAYRLRLHTAEHGVDGLIYAARAFTL